MIGYVKLQLRQHRKSGALAYFFGCVVNDADSHAVYQLVENGSLYWAEHDKFFEEWKEIGASCDLLQRELQR